MPLNEYTSQWGSSCREEPKAKIVEDYRCLESGVWGLREDQRGLGVLGFGLKKVPLEAHVAPTRRRSALSRREEVATLNPKPEGVKLHFPEDPELTGA